MDFANTLPAEVAAEVPAEEPAEVVEAWSVNQTRNSVTIAFASTHLVSYSSVDPLGSDCTDDHVAQH